jgi:hypothetical protein
MQEINYLILVQKPIFPLSFSPNYEKEYFNFIVLFTDITCRMFYAFHIFQYILFFPAIALRKKKGKIKPIRKAWIENRSTYTLLFKTEI